MRVCRVGHGQRQQRQKRQTRRDRCLAPAAAQRPGQPKRSKGIGQKQRESGGNQPRPQVHRLREGEGHTGYVGGGVGGTGQLRLRLQRVQRHWRIGGPVKARRVVERSGAGKIGGDRLGAGGWRNKSAKTIETAGRGQQGCLLCLILARFRAGLATLGSHGDDTLQHADEQAGQGQVRPRGIGTDMHQDHQALAAPGGGDERRTIGEGRPGFRAQARFRLGQNLTRDDDLIGCRQAKKRAVAVEWGELFGRVPRQ